MRPKEKYNLSDMLKEIEEDILEQKHDFRQEKNIPQETITELMLTNLKQNKKIIPDTGHSINNDEVTKD